MTIQLNRFLQTCLKYPKTFGLNHRKRTQIGVIANARNNDSKIIQQCFFYQKQ